MGKGGDGGGVAGRDEKGVVGAVETTLFGVLVENVERAVGAMLCC